MKRIGMWLMAAALGLGVAGAQGQGLVTAGSSELGVGGELDFASAAGVVTALDVRYAYFFWDRISLGGVAGVYDDDNLTRGEIGVTGEYNYQFGSEYRPLIGVDFVPYAGLGILFAYADAEHGRGAAVFEGEAGVKFFLTESAAVTLSLTGDVATDKIYADDDDVQNWDLALKLGMRFYF